MTDLRDVRCVCYLAARRTGGAVVEFRIAENGTPTFHQGLIAHRDQTVTVVCADDSPVLAVAEPRDLGCGSTARQSGPSTFVDAPELVAVLAGQPGFPVLTASELNGPFDAVAWPDVSSYDLRYRQPGNLGEALFTDWD